ncbi:LacI family DNA-binding transcriptional regulator [Xanthomonas perforans]|uniref:LacI family DNA-binding transcriptional regulator n=1 Tax=Xanthomonas perforans TaxID=442694 RepID=UPI00115EACFF|nr:substrate-binding domain-containing protein [Xanthomonas perforans]TQT67506.1 transcriptional regulator [Xanthomonas perforans]
MPLHASFFHRKACHVTPAKPTPEMTADDGTPGARRGAVTLRDIASAIGVSRATVSLVLRGSPLVHASTRARVEAELDRQNYVYNRAAANLRQRTSSSVALVINDLSNPFFAEFAAGVDEALGAAGYVTLLGSTGESTQRQQAVLTSLMEHTPAGIILSPAEGSQAQALTQVLGRQRNVVLFNREVEGAQWDLLALDNAQGAFEACSHLIAQGHRRIVFFGGHAASSSCRQRRAGYARAMQEADLETHYVESAPNRQDAALCGARLLSTAAQAATAAVCYNDSVALGLMAALARHGIVPGRDLAATDSAAPDTAARSTHALPPRARHPRARGRPAAQLVLQRIGSPELAAQQLTAAVALNIRASSACGPTARMSSPPQSGPSAHSPTKASGR